MNMHAEIYARCHSGVVHLTFFKDRKRIAAGSGFMLSGKLVTNHHVFYVPVADKVVIKTVKHDRDNEDGIVLTWREFSEMIIDGAPESGADYAILDVPQLTAAGLHSFHFESLIQPAIGREYAVLGYPLDHNNLTLHRGSISSFFRKAGMLIIQLDASVNNGNSGGPLVELTDGGVIGIVTRKNTGLTNAFDALRAGLVTNVKIIQRATSTISID